MKTEQRFRPCTRCTRRVEVWPYAGRYPEIRICRRCRMEARS